MSKHLAENTLAQLACHHKLLHELLEPFSYLNAKDPVKYCLQIYSEVEALKSIIKLAGSDSWALELHRQAEVLTQIMKEKNTILMQQLPYFTKSLMQTIAPLGQISSLADLLKSETQDDQIPQSIPMEKSVVATARDKEVFHYVLVDDEPDFLEILEDHLKDHFSKNFKPIPHAFADPIQALETLKIMETCKIHLIFTDYKMPKMNGETFIQQVRSIQGLEKTPIIMITGMKPDLQNAMRSLENVYFLEKPFSEKRLAFYLNCCLKHQLSAANSTSAA